MFKETNKFLNKNLLLLYGHLLENSHLKHRMMNISSLNSAVK